MNSSNVIDKQSILKLFYNPGISFTISSRNILKDMTIREYVQLYYSYLSLEQIESFFGFAEDFSPLYGGRNFQTVFKLTHNHIEELYKNNISLSLTLTNHNYSDKSYRQTYTLLKKYHNASNSIVCVNDDLALQIKNDFPLYHLKASLIKNLNSRQKIVDALKLYDSAVVPMDMNNNDEFLQSLPEKRKIILFGNTGCAYNCPSRICYRAVSNKIANKSLSKIKCSKQTSTREELGNIYFNVVKFVKMGFLHFKLIPDPTIRVIKKTFRSKQFYFNIINKNKKIFHLFSYPKSGRTWLRFMLANYINQVYRLGIDIDLNSLFTLLPNDEISKNKGINGYGFMEDDRFPLLVSTHKIIKKVEINCDSAIFLLRSVHDVLVSEYFQQVHKLKTFNGPIGQFLREKNSSLTRCCMYINELSIKRTRKTLILTYEMMHKNTYQTLSQTLAFLGIPIDMDMLNRSIELSRFDRMREVELSKGLAGNMANENEPDSLRVRRGQIGNYKEYLDRDDIIFINEHCTINLSTAAKSFLQEYNINYSPDVIP